MRYQVLGLFLMVPLFVNAQVVSEGDRHSGTLECSLKNPVSIDSESPELDGMYQPVYISDTWGINLFLTSDYEHPLSREVYLVHFLIDDELSEAFMFQRDILKREGQEISSWFIMLEEDEFRKIAAANNVRLRVGKAIFTVSKDRRKYMNDIIDLVAMN